ncbi:TetR/AcrR family transcriptional regulator [Azospirillum thermophilum]|uniref:TetR family transcriptional regulator n=1 Tax=Azospirillum thermophilum TaxID=2202148 RepID=A0A2S2CQM9_9PROT|nr:TetR/AcrR family transcriptional regulator [Azospirillum thermophilum]AWK86786.1 TetR family transcriptional regulator [Azospirillum thermophilum]
MPDEPHPLHEPAPRWRRRKEARPQEIVAAAMDVFAERGFAAAKLDEVAGRAGVSKGTLYLYFPNKEELFKAVIRAAILPNLEEAERMLAADDGPSFALLERLLTMVAERVLTTRIAVVPKLVIAEAGNFPELAAFYHREVISRGFALLAGLLRRGIARGEFRPVEVEHTVRLIVAPLLFGAIWRSSFEAAVEGGPLDLRGLVAAHLDHLRRALRPEGGPS